MCIYGKKKTALHTEKLYFLNTEQLRQQNYKIQNTSDEQKYFFIIY